MATTRVQPLPFECEHMFLKQSKFCEVQNSKLIVELKPTTTPLHV